MQCYLKPVSISNLNGITQDLPGLANHLPNRGSLGELDKLETPMGY